MTANTLSAVKQPVCLITHDGKALLPEVSSRMISVTLTDNKTGEADTLTIELDDTDGAILLPKRGVRLCCQMGYGQNLYDKGEFTVDEVSWQGPPDTVTITARAVDFTGHLKTGKTRSFHQITLGELAKTIAQEHQLQLKITRELSMLALGHIDQSSESNLNLLSRLGHELGFAYSIKAGSLLIFETHQSKSASGQPLATLAITRQDGDQYRYSESDREQNYTGVAAYWQDHGKAKRKKVEAGHPEPKGGGNDPRYKTKVLKKTYANEAIAKRAAAAEMHRVQTRMASFSINLALGMPECSTESPVKLQGFKKELDEKSWVILKATHNFSKRSGLTTQLELEAKLSILLR